MEKIIARISEAAEMLCTSPNTIKRILEEGKLPAYREGRCWSIPVTAIKRYAEERAESEAAERRKKWLVG